MYDSHHKQSYRALPISARHQSYTFGSNIHAKDSDMWAYCCYPHSHDTLEILLISDGIVNWRIGDRAYRLSEGDMLIVNPFEIHSGILHVEDGTASYYVVQIELAALIPQVDAATGEILRRVLNGSDVFREYFAAVDTGTMKTLIPTLQAVYSEQENPSVICLQLSYVWAILSNLLLHLSGSTHSAAEQKRYHFIQRMEKYISENFRRDISTAEASSFLGYSVSHFCRLFSACYGMNFMRYLRSYRIRQAAHRYLDRRNMTIAEIAADVGFTDYNYFSRAFRKEIGLAPSEYFNRRRSIPGQAEQKII